MPGRKIACWIASLAVGKGPFTNSVEQPIREESVTEEALALALGQETNWRFF